MTRRSDGDITRRVRKAMILYALCAVAVVGGISFFLIRNLILGNIRQGIEAEAVQKTQRLEQALASIQDDLKNLSANSLILNAIIDTGGSRLYIDPFIRSYRLNGNIPFHLTICDYGGNPIASNAKPPDTFSQAEILKTTIDAGRPYAGIHRHEGDNTARILLAYPVVWTMTGKPEGLLVGDVGLRDVVEQVIPFGEGDGELSLAVRDAGGVVYARNAGRKDRLLRVVKPLLLPAPLRDLALRVEIDDHRRIGIGWLAPAYALAAIALMVVAVIPARRISTALTSHLSALSGTAREIAESGSLEIKAEIAGPEEVRVLAASLNAMIEKLKKSHDELEARVAERTAELTASNAGLSRANAEKEKLIGELQEALASIKTLRGLLPICSSCKKIRDDSGYWNQIDSYLAQHSDLDFSHGICPDCAEKLYGKPL